MSNLIPFTYGETPVRVVQIAGEPWFVLSDLCAVLAISNPSMVAQRLDDVNLSRTEVENARGQMRQIAIVSEPGMYEVVIRSDKPEAVAFRRWITGEVLPAIRKTGTYGTVPKQLTEDEIVHQALQITARKVEALEAQVEELSPRAHAWDDLASATGDYSVGDAAKVLSRAGIKTGQNRLFSTLGELGWTFRRSGYWQAMQTAVDQGLVVERVRPPRYDQLTGEQITVAPQIRLTAKAIEKLRTQLGGTRGGALIAVSS